MDLQKIQRGKGEKLETKILRTVVRYLKEGGKKNIMKDYDRVMLSQRQKGKVEGKNEEREEHVLTMCKDPSFTDAQIDKIGKIPVSQVLALRKRLAEAKQN